MKVSLKIKKLQRFKTLVQYSSENEEIELRSSQQPFLAENQRMVTCQKQSNVKTKTLLIRPVKTKRKHDITSAIDSNVPYAKKAGRSMVSNIKHFNRK